MSKRLIEDIDEIALDEMIIIKYNNRTKKGSGSMSITVTELKCNLGNDADVEAARAERNDTDQASGVLTLD